MAVRAPIVLGEDGGLEQLQAGDSVWESVLSEQVPDDTFLSFGEISVGYDSDEDTLLLSRESEGSIISISGPAGTVLEVHSSGYIRLEPAQVPMTDIPGAVVFDGQDLYVGVS